MGERESAGKKETKEKKGLVLLVDDDPEVLAAMENAMRTLSTRIDKATNGNQAVDKLGRTDPDVVVLDVMLPRKSGFLVMERIRETRKKRDSDRPYVIMVTANTGQRHKQYAKSLGVDEYMTKPFRMDRLLEMTGSFLEKCQEGNQDD